MADVGDKDVEARVTTLVNKLMNHKKAIVLIEIELSRLIYAGGRRQSKVTREKKSDLPALPDEPIRNDLPLPLFAYEILVRESLTMRDLVKKIMSRGYKTKAKNFASCVQQAIHVLQKCEAVSVAKEKNEDKKRVYVGIGMDRDELRRRLTAQNRTPRRRAT